MPLRDTDPAFWTQSYLPSWEKVTGHIFVVTARTESEMLARCVHCGLVAWMRMLARGHLRLGPHAVQEKCPKRKEEGEE